MKRILLLKLQLISFKNEIQNTFFRAAFRFYIVQQ